MATGLPTASVTASASASASASAFASVLAINSPSDLSYCSGPCHASTRNTSPVSDPVSVSEPIAAAVTRSVQSSPLIDLSVAGDIECTPDTLLDDGDSANGGGDKDRNGKKYGKMDKNAFQSVNDRRSKLVSQAQNGHQLTPQPQIARSGMQAPSTHRSLTSANWRAHQTEEPALSQPRIMYSNPFNSPPRSFIRTTPYPGPLMDQHQHLQLPALTSYPSFGPIPDAQLEDSYAYCYDRGNGQYTRLIPADMLPPLQNIPSLQQGCAGMVVVPQPRGLPSNGHLSNMEPVAFKGAPATPTSPTDTIQSRIDNIVAATPPTPTRVTSAGHHGGGPTSSGSAPPGQRRPKIYCDKWVHEGVCAFTQQGCKYKHEMPSDKVTQHQLGLFHGYPQWWKKHQADLARQRDVPASVEGPTSGSSNDSRLGNERYLSRTHATVGSGGSRSGCLGLTSNAGGQLAWQHRSEYAADQQGLGTPASAIGRVSASRALSAAMRNPMTSSPTGNDLSPCPASYGSPFGPIAPPARSHAAVMVSTESIHGQSGMEPIRLAQRGRGNSSVGSGMPSISMIPTSNPYASLGALGDNGEGNVNEVDGYGDPSGLGDAHSS
ncbi:hypothetical protein F4861DRAFT_546691 [Xylaria intraflava]|nr:hypothetical protein F4861DRAFT_546691 [Xylaria intraflava]